MDTSEIYIEMCEKAIELQKDVWDGSYSPRETRYYDKKTKTFFNHWQIGVWCPTVEQMQELLFIDRDGNLAQGETIPQDASWVIQDLSKCIQKHGWNDTIVDTLWLKYLMLKKYNKVWNGNAWVGISNGKS